MVPVLVSAVALLMVADPAQSDFKTEAEAATAAVQQAVTMTQDTELAGVVYKTASGEYHFTTPVGTGVAGEVEGDWHVRVPAGSKITASYHTHPAREFSDFFSGADIETYKKTGLTGYVGVLMNHSVMRWDGHTKPIRIQSRLTVVGLGTVVGNF